MTHFFYSRKQFLPEAETIASNYSTDPPSLSIRRKDLPILVHFSPSSFSANNLPVFEIFQTLPAETPRLTQIFRNTPTCFVFFDCLFKKFPLKEVFYLTKNTVEYRKYSLIFRRLDDKATRTFFCCFTLNKKIE